MEEEKDHSHEESNSAPFVLAMPPAPLMGEPGETFKPGAQCPNCRTGRLDYDGCLNLACPNCGYALSGCFT